MMQVSLDDKLVTAVFAGVGVVIAAVGTAIGASRGRHDRESPPLTEASPVTLSGSLLRQMLDIASENQAKILATQERMEANQRIFTEAVAKMEAALIGIRAMLEMSIRGGGYDDP